MSTCSPLDLFSSALLTVQRHQRQRRRPRLQQQAYETAAAIAKSGHFSRSALFFAAIHAIVFDVCTQLTRDSLLQEQSIDRLIARPQIGRQRLLLGLLLLHSFLSLLSVLISLCAPVVAQLICRRSHKHTVCVCVCSCTIVHSFVKCTLSAYHTHRTLIILSRPVLLPSDLHYLPTDCSLLSPSSTEHSFGFN